MHNDDSKAQEKLLFQESPLQNPEIDPKSIADLFSTDPRELSREDRRKIVDELRRRRQTFSEAKNRAKASGKRTPKSAGVTLKDLGAKDKAMASVSDMLSKVIPGKKK